MKVEKLTSFAEPDLKGKELSEGEEFWFKGALGKDVQGWALKPKGWKAGEKKKWPAILLIHGGPQGAWEDQWSTRWNPNGELFLLLSFFGPSINLFSSSSLRSAGILCYYDQPDRKHHLWTRFVYVSLSFSSIHSEFNIME